MGNWTLGYLGRMPTPCAPHRDRRELDGHEDPHGSLERTDHGCVGETFALRRNEGTYDAWLD